MKQKYSLFLLEKVIDSEGYLRQSCFDYVNSYATLEAAQCHAENIKLKTLIIPSY